jgi:hypothetical protein
MNASLVYRANDRDGLDGREPETGLQDRNERPAYAIVEPALTPLGNRVDHLG